MATQITTPAREPVIKKFKTAAENDIQQRQASIEEKREERYRNAIDEIGNHSGLNRPNPQVADKSAKRSTQSTSTHARSRDELRSRPSSANPAHTSTTLMFTPSQSPRSKADTAQIAELKAEIGRQKEEVQHRETTLEEERINVARLQDQQEEHEEALLQAILKHDLEAKEKSQSQVTALTAMIKEARERIKDLQSQIAEGQQRELDLSRQLHESRRANLALHASLADKDCHDSATKQQSDSPCAVELSSDVEVRPRERQTLRQSADSGGIEKEAESRASSSKGSKQRRDQRTPTRGAYISVPRGEGRRGLIPLPMRT